MALSLALRNCCRFQGLSHGIKAVENSKIFSRRYTSLLSNAKKFAPNAIVPGTALARRGMSGDHSKLWPVEKLVTLGLLGIVPAAIITPNLILDDIFAILTVVHFHWGLEACAVDYVRPILFGKAIPKATVGLVYLLSFATLGGLLYYNHHCIGIGCTVRQLWKIRE